MPGAKRHGELTRSEELNYLVNWFSEFSEMQKSDFFKIIVKKYAGSVVDENTITNALLSLKLTDRPPTIFHCRMKLFDEWFTNWSDEDKENLLLRLRNLDSQFMDFFQSLLDGNPLDEETFCQPILQLRPTTDTKLDNLKQLNGNGTNGCSDTSTPSPVEDNNINENSLNSTDEVLTSD